MINYNLYVICGTVIICIIIIGAYLDNILVNYFNSLEKRKNG